MSSDQHKTLPLRERSQRRFLLISTQPEWVHYLSSVIFIAICTLLLLLLQRFVAEYDGLARGPAFVALYFIAIAVATVIGGLRAGLFAVLLSLFSTAYFLIPPVGNMIAPTMMNYVTLAIVVTVGSLVALGMEAYRNNTHLLVRNLDLLAVEQARANQETVLNRIGQAVRSASHPEQVLSIAVESVGQMLDADRCYFITYNHSKDSAFIEHYWRKDGLTEPELSFRASDLGVDPESMYALGRTMVVYDSQSNPSFQVAGGQLNQLGVRSAIMVPLTVDGQLELTLVVGMSDAPRVWDRNDVSLVETVASQTRVAVDAARVQQKEHNIAIQLQAALQPEISLNVDGVGIASFYRAALEEANVGGDFYDAFTLSSGQTAFVLGDVSGKGLAAASQVAAIRHMLRCLLQTSPNVVSAIEQLNDVLIQQQLLPAFATLFVGVFNPASLMLEYVSCGHEPGLIYRVGETNEVIQLPSNGPVIGVFEQTYVSSLEGLFVSSRQQLLPGDTLLLYTDGVCDAGPDVRCLLGVNGISSILVRFHEENAEKKSFDVRQVAENLISHCVAATEDYTDGFLRDDICLLAVKISTEYDVKHYEALARPHLQKSFIRAFDNKLDTDSQRKTLIADVLRLATKGKLQIVSLPQELPAKLEFAADPVRLDVGENVRRLRRSVRDAAAEAGLASDFADSLEMAAGEAANNSLVHATNGIGSVSWDLHGHVQVRIEDSGKGIPYDDLPRATLERGYTTAGTLGQGFWIILQSVKLCWIATSQEGTTVVLEQDNSDTSAETLPTSLFF